MFAIGAFERPEAPDARGPDGRAVGVPVVTEGTEAADFFKAIAPAKNF
jgi:hypothetical protein